MCLKQCHKSPMTGNGNHITFKNGDDWGMVYDIVLTTLSHFRSGFKMGKSEGNWLQLLTIFVIYNSSPSNLPVLFTKRHCNPHWDRLGAPTS